jgi:hypothetical protein
MSALTDHRTLAEAIANHRTLMEIGDELGAAIRYRTGGMLKIGRLLNEAKDLLIEHGDWLKYLNLYRIKPRSAQRYMIAATWADKLTNTTVTDVFERITADAIYEMASGKKKPKYSDDVIEQVIEADQASSHRPCRLEVDRQARSKGIHPAGDQARVKA